MVQPQPDGPMQWDMSGEDSGGALRVPPELAANEVVTKLLGDNQQLREALRRSNLALRQRCEEMEGWQRRTREEREFLSCRFQEARALVERLAQENHSLQGLVNGPASSSNHSCSSSQTEDLQGRPPRNGPADGPQVSQFYGSKQTFTVLSVGSFYTARKLRNVFCEVSQRHHKIQKNVKQDFNFFDYLQFRFVRRYRELEEKLDYLQKSSAQRDRTEALLKQKDKDCAQLAKDCESLKAQATSLLGELKERQSCLDKSEMERNMLEEKLCSKVKALQVAEREQEQQRKQHHVAMDKLLLQTQSLEQALKTERHVVTEEKKKLTQLQHAYTCLFRDYDSKLKSEVKTHLSLFLTLFRLEEAERALALKQDLIDKLKEEVEQQKGSLETVPVLTAQAEIYKADFLAEREAREKLNQKKEELQDQLNKAMTDIERLKQEATSRARMEQMKLRHLEDFPARPPNIPPPQGTSQLVQTHKRLKQHDLPDLCCPKCQYLAPDMDTLQIHVMDCIQ
uniref:NF-kappa-B essential modulator n=1 Tax=Acanthochromis polyacanthus TaxID=80966 RepID=A0A3Q1ETI9_9TELE